MWSGQGAPRMRPARSTKRAGPPTRTGWAVRHNVKFFTYNNFYGLQGIKGVML